MQVDESVEQDAVRVRFSKPESDFLHDFRIANETVVEAWCVNQVDFAAIALKGVGLY